MRVLSKEESEIFFAKLSTFIGENISLLLSRSDTDYCFRVHASKVYYTQTILMNKSLSIPSKSLSSFGTLFGRFTKSLKFRLAITALEHLSQFAKHKVWVKAGGEMSFMYGNHILKTHLGRVTEDCKIYEGVIIYTMSDIAIGFGVLAKSTIDLRGIDATSIAVFHQCDVGEYLRDEDSLF